jgi:hypothetical protein
MAVGYPSHPAVTWAADRASSEVFNSLPTENFSIRRSRKNFSPFCFARQLIEFLHGSKKR